MPRLKERRKIIHEPSTKEIFICLKNAPKFSELLLKNSPVKPYTEFLKWLCENGYNLDFEQRITIKKIASDFKGETSKVTKWIKEIYEEIFELNSEKPELFRSEGIQVYLIMHRYDSSGYFFTSLPVLPREYESFDFPFIKAKLGTDQFWIKRIGHSLFDSEVVIDIWLEGHLLNRYREFSLEKALFQGWITFWDKYEMSEFQIDDTLKKLFRN